MKVCFVGLGSIGKRHLNNLRKIYRENLQIDAVRSSKNRLDESILNMICNQYYSLDEIPNNYDVIFITNPTNLHYEVIKNAVYKAKNLFIEKPIFDQCVNQINQINFNNNNINYVACPLRHKTIMKYIKDTICKNEKIVSVRAISSSYLPDWRKGVDYRECYSAKKVMGGGVTIDLIHEWDYLTDLFGYPINMYYKKGHISDLEIDSDDVAIYMAEYEDMYLELHLDYIGHKNERKLELYCNDKSYYIDLISNTIEKYQRGVQVDVLKFEQEDFYINEMQYFLSCIERKCENINTPEKAYRVLALAMGENYE